MNFIDSMAKDNYGWTLLIQWTKIMMDELHSSLLVDMFIKIVSNCLLSETFLVILNHCDSVQCKSCFEEKEKCTELQVYDNASKQKWCCMHVWLVLCSTRRVIFSAFLMLSLAKKSKWCVYNQGKMNSSLNNALKSNCAL